MQYAMGWPRCAQRVDDAPRAVDRAAFLVARDDEGDRAGVRRPCGDDTRAPPSSSPRRRSSCRRRRGRTGGRRGRRARTGPSSTSRAGPAARRRCGPRSRRPARRRRGGSPRSCRRRRIACARLRIPPPRACARAAPGSRRRPASPTCGGSAPSSARACLTSARLYRVGGQRAFGRSGTLARDCGRNFTRSLARPRPPPRARGVGRAGCES